MKNLPDGILASLASAGFVHITGLTTHGPLNCQENKVEAQVKDLGRWGTNNGKTSLVTSDGQVWLGVGTPTQELVTELCPNGEGAFVPCSNGETIWLHEILYRLAHPGCNA